MLKDIVVSENSIEEIPPTIISMVNLKVLKLTNNKLRTLPFELAGVLTLEEID
jgi:Leucine-rich repeat (LRR) protein